MAGFRRMCAGGIQAVKILHGDGQVLSLAARDLKVGDVLTRHPHHYICHMSPDQSNENNKSMMLPLDAELEPGSVYLLLPLPRLFPGNSASPSCSCYVHDKLQRQEGNHHNHVSLQAFKQVITRIGSPLRSPKKISPYISSSSSRSEPSSTNPYSPNYGKENLSPVYKRNRNSPKRGSKSRSGSPSLPRAANPYAEDPVVCSRWKPRLGCISETDALVTAYEELRLSLDRRRLTFECRGRPPGSPLRYGELSRSPSRTSSAGVYCRSPSRDVRSSMTEPCTQKQTMSLGGYLLM